MKKNIWSIAVVALTLVVGCAAAPEEETTAPPPPSSEDTDQARPGDDGAEGDGAEEPGTISSAIVYNRCSCLDPSQMKSCSGGICTCYRRTSTWVRYYTAACPYLYCPKYEAYRC
jgi:hypothetical protein